MPPAFSLYKQNAKKALMAMVKRYVPSKKK
jgi:hypothetical protein